MAERHHEGMLSPYRVLDLTGEDGAFCGKLLGDLGADVIKVEPPGGDPARFVGPFYHDEVDPEKSLSWWAFNTSKRGITLDIEKAAGREIFRTLAAGADFIIEPFPPGYLSGLGPGYADLERQNPGLIMASITPFGQTGPHRDYKCPDIVAWDLGAIPTRSATLTALRCVSATTPTRTSTPPPMPPSGRCWPCAAARCPGKDSTSMSPSRRRCCTRRTSKRRPPGGTTSASTGIARTPGRGHHQ